MLTPTKKKVLDFITSYTKRRNVSPSLEEIRRGLRRKSVSTIHQHVEELKDGGYLNKEIGRHRSIEIPMYEAMIKIPLLGVIAAGEPLTLFDVPKETIAVPAHRIGNSKDIYALRVQGDSMIEENINDKDVVLVKHQSTAENGQKVVAIIDNQKATLKRFYKEKSYIRLQPANKNYEPIIIKNNDREISIQGVVLDVIREEKIPSLYIEKPKLIKKPVHKSLPVNKILNGDAIELLKSIPSDSIDMTFADPPFNLNKKYGSYKDNIASSEYIMWCEAWLTEMTRITKPTGSIFVHNIPKWLTYYATHLNKIAYFKHWIAWDAMSAPLGKSLLPAHYGILFYTKSPKGFKFHELRSPHKKCRSCGEMIKDYGGKKKQINPYGTLLSDVWSDLHRIRHNVRRDEHPCQLPEPLLERLVLMSTDEGDIVLDPFVGAGTTVLAAKRLGRNYIGIDLDKKYQKIVADKLKQIKYRSSNGYKYDVGDKKISKYLRNLTISEDEGIYPISS